MIINLLRYVKASLSNVCKPFFRITQYIMRQHELVPVLKAAVSDHIKTQPELRKTSTCTNCSHLQGFWLDWTVIAVVSLLSSIKQSKIEHWKRTFKVCHKIKQTFKGKHFSHNSIFDQNCMNELWLCRTAWWPWVNTKFRHLYTGVLYRLLPKSTAILSRGPLTSWGPSVFSLMVTLMEHS